MESPFQNKIALIGHVSAGKTTVLNALFAAYYGEVSMKRTTAGINYFRINSREAQAPEEIHSRIQRINVDLRLHPQIKEQYFDVAMPTPLLEMRRNTQLVVVDIPGLNEARTSKMYQDHVRSIWNTFDCVIVVMDVNQGVNTEEQVQLLRFVQENAHKTSSPVIVLCNKVDDPEDPEIQGLVQEMKNEVAQMFSPAKPDVIPISAHNALYGANIIMFSGNFVWLCVCGRKSFSGDHMIIFSPNSILPTFTERHQSFHKTSTCGLAISTFEGYAGKNVGIALKK